MADVAQNANRKRQKIAQSSRTMFLWVAGMSAVVGFAAVMIVFLVQHILFQAKVIDEKNKTVSTLNDSVRALPGLKDNIRLLDTNVNLKNLKANPDDRSLQVILDALPASENTLALGSSLQNKLLNNVPNVSIESISPGGDSEGGSSTEEGGSGQVPFQVTLKANSASDLKEALRHLERSIRIIDIDKLTIDQGESDATMTVSGHAYFEQARQYTLSEKVVK